MVHLMVGLDGELDGGLDKLNGRWFDLDLMVKLMMHLMVDLKMMDFIWWT